MLLILAGIATDIADGLLARLLKAESPAGGIFDNLADFFFIFCIFLVFNKERIFTPLLTAAAMVSFILYAANCCIRRQIIHTKLGIGTGFACMTAILISSAGRVFYPPQSALINAASSYLCIAYLLTASVENIIIIISGNRGKN